MLIRTTGQTNRQLPDQLYRLWRNFYPGKILEFNWISDSLAKQYANEEKLQASFTSLGWLSIVLACLGLFGLVFFAVNNRTKEIGIRKALGASAPEIIFLISKSYLKLILIAITIASPIALWIGSSWLSGFAYHVDLSWEMFVFVWLLIFVLGLSTLSITAARAALRKPALALRTE
jgi:putative ABC transport system permease protein